MQQPAVQPRASLLPAKTMTFPGELYFLLKDEAELYEMSVSGYVKMMVQRGRDASETERRGKTREAMRDIAQASTGA